MGDDFDWNARAAVLRGMAIRLDDRAAGLRGEAKLLRAIADKLTAQGDMRSDAADTFRVEKTESGSWAVMKYEVTKRMLTHWERETDAVSDMDRRRYQEAS